jgi:hypothetical protein
MLVKLIGKFTPDDVGDEPTKVMTASEDFLVRRVGPKDKKHHYQVWSAFLWGQQQLTGTQWRNCVSFEAAVQLMNRYSE